MLFNLKAGVPLRNSAWSVGHERSRKSKIRRNLCIAIHRTSQKICVFTTRHLYADPPRGLGCQGAREDDQRPRHTLFCGSAAVSEVADAVELQNVQCLIAWKQLSHSCRVSGDHRHSARVRHSNIARSVRDRRTETCIESQDIVSFLFASRGEEYTAPVHSSS